MSRGLCQRGFGLLEAIVALALLGSVGLVLFSWINQSMAETVRIKNAEARAQLQLDAQAWLNVLNPALQPTGEQKIGDITLHWSSALVEPMRDEFDFGGSLIPRWHIGLFRVSASASRAGETVEWQQLVAGWQPIGTPTPTAAGKALK